MTSSLRIGRYIRISRREQRSGLDRQLFMLEKCASDLGGSLEDSPLWVDIQSGRDFDRLQFQAMLSAIQSKQVDVIIAYRVDRLARDLEVSAQLAKLFEATGIRLYDLQKGGFVDFKNPEDWANYAHSGVAAEAESRRLARRIRAGYEFNRTMGKASSKPPWGYIRNKATGKYELDPALADAARDTVKLFLETGNAQKTCRTIARKWKKQWSDSGLRTWIRNPVLRGHSGYDLQARKWGKVVYDSHPDHAILTEAQLKALESQISDRRAHWQDDKPYNPQPLSSVVYCGRCGTKMVVTRGTYCPAHGEKPYYFSCRDRNHRIKPNPCTVGRSCPVAPVEAFVIAELIKAYETLSIIAQKPEEYKDSPDVIELKRTLSQLERLGDNPAIESAKSQLIAQIAQAQARQSFSTSDAIENRALFQAAFSDRLTFETLPPDEKKSIYNSLISKILCHCTEEVTGEISRRRNPKMRVSWSFEIHLKPLGI